MIKYVPSADFFSATILGMSEVFEKNCRVGVVTSVDDDFAQMLYLHSRKATATESLDAAAELEKDLAFSYHGKQLIPMQLFHSRL